MSTTAYWYQVSINPPRALLYYMLNPNLTTYEYARSAPSRSEKSLEVTGAARQITLVLKKSNAKANLRSIHSLWLLEKEIYQHDIRVRKRPKNKSTGIWMRRNTHTQSINEKQAERGYNKLSPADMITCLKQFNNMARSNRRSCLSARASHCFRSP